MPHPAECPNCETPDNDATADETQATVSENVQVLEPETYQPAT